MAPPITPCPLCGASLKRALAGRGGGPHFDCPNCGRYGISDFHVDMNGALTLEDDTRVKLKQLLNENRVRKGAPVFLSSSTGGTAAEGEAIIGMAEFLERYPRTPLEFFDRALENLAQPLKHPTEVFQVYVQTYFSMLCEQTEGQQMIQQLMDLGYVANTVTGSGHSGFMITAKGWQRVSELRQPGRDSKQAFVAMSFAPEYAQFFDSGIKPAIEADQKMKAYRIDRADHNNRIDDQIIAEIRRSRYLVSDFTAHRQGVYFEAGFALGLGLPVIWCVHRDHLKDAHFDTRQYNHITYATAEELREKLLNRIRATILSF